MSADAGTHGHYRLTERLSGDAAVATGGREYAPVRFEIERYQGLSHAGMPIPGLHRIEGTLDLAALPETARRVGQTLTLNLPDGRSIGLVLADAGGRVLAEGHGPAGCLCC